MTRSASEQHDEELAGYGAAEEGVSNETPPQEQPTRPEHEDEETTMQGAEARRGPLPDQERD
jgi:hypothetical protein